MQLLKKIDLFGTIITFRVYDDEQFHSLISIILSIITLISTILFTYLFGLDFIFHTESKVLQSTKILKDYQYYNLKFEDLFFAWRIEGFSSEEANFTNFLFPTFTYFSYIKGNAETIKYEKCKNFNFSFNIPSDIKEFYCSDISNFSFGGGWENDNEIEFFTFGIDTCKNQSCITQEDFQKLVTNLGKLYFVIYYPTISFVPDENIPYQITYNKKYISLDFELSAYNRFYIRKNIFEDDIGWMLTSLKTKNIFGFSTIETESHQSETYIYSYDKNHYIYSATFYIDKNISYYKRLFTKAYESLSLINGFFKVLYLIFGFISSLCNKFLLFEKIMINYNSEDINYEKMQKSNSHLENNNFQNNNNCNNRSDGSNINLKIINNNLIYPSNLISKINKENSSYIYKSNNEKIKEYEKEKGMISSTKNNMKIGSEEVYKVNKNFPKNINYTIKYNKSISCKTSKNLNYKLLFIHFFRCLLTKKTKLEYKINIAKTKIIRKKINIHNYLDLEKRFYLLYIQINKGKMQLNNNDVRNCVY